MQSLNFKYFYQTFIDYHTVYGKRVAVNLLFYGSSESGQLSQSTVSKMQSDSYSFSVRSKPFKDYYHLSLQTKVNYLRFLRLRDVPSSGAELCNRLISDGFNLSNDLFYQLQTQSDIHFALINLLECIMHGDATCQKTDASAKSSTMLYLSDSTLANALSANNTTVPLDNLKEPLGWYIKMLCTHNRINTAEIAQKAHMSRVKFMEKTSPKARNQKHLFLSDIQDICLAMNTSLGNVLYCYEHQDLIESNPTLIPALSNSSFIFSPALTSGHFERSSLISNPSEDPFKRWFGTYYCYFPSTDSSEITARKKRYARKLGTLDDKDELFDLFSDDHIYSGILSISPVDSNITSHCSAHFRFMVNPEQPFVKEYDGIVTISLEKKAIFIELRSEKEAELAYIIFDDQFTLNVRCAIGQVLTISSRELHHRPCSERIFISDTKIEPNSQLYQIMKANLMMHDKNIRIDEFGYSLVLDDLIKTGNDEAIAFAHKYKDLESLKSIGNVQIRKCAYISEGFFDLTHFSKMQNITFETALRQHSIAPWNAKTNSKTAAQLFELMCDFSNANDK